MNKVFIKMGILSTVIMLSASCKKGDTGATGASGGSAPLTGNIEGLITLYDAGSVKQYGATVNTGDSITLINNSNGAVYKTTTSSTGTYTFANVTAGTYSFTASKPGYGPVKVFGFEFAGGGTAYRNLSLAQTPTVNITSAVATTTVSSATPPVNEVEVSGVIPASTENTYIITFVSMPSSTFVNGVFGNYSSYFTSSVSAGATTFNIYTPVTTLYNYGFTSGNTVYFASYIYAQNSVYTDPLTGLNVYTALSSTPIYTSVILP